LDAIYLSTNKTSGAYRAIEIILGIIALAAGILALIYPGAVVVSLVVFFGIILTVVGIFRVATAVFLPPGARWANATIGILALVFGILILVAPFFATEILIIFLGVALLIYGAGRVAVGVSAKALSGGMRTLLILLGLIVLILGIVVIFFPAIGVYTYAFFVSIAFLLIGIDAIASGVAGTSMT
jgi:uncharacterized membrane protein HdeD (DUF308 family)